MWIRKSEVDIEDWHQQQDRKRKDIIRPLLVSFGISTAGLMLYSLGYRGSVRGFIFFSNSSYFSVIRLLFLFLILFVIIFSIAIYNQRRYGALTPSGSDVLLCQNCKTPTSFNAEKRCSCGGNLEPYGYFDWVEKECITPSTQ